MRRVESFGVFVDLAGCRTAGLAQVSELADGKVADVATLYRVGLAVRAKVGNAPHQGLGFRETFCFVFFLSRACRFWRISWRRRGLPPPTLLRSYTASPA